MGQASLQGTKTSFLFIFTIYSCGEKLVMFNEINALTNSLKTEIKLNVSHFCIQPFGDTNIDIDNLCINRRISSFRLQQSIVRYEAKKR